MAVAALGLVALPRWFPRPREPAYRWVRGWGGTGTDPGSFQGPIGVAVVGEEVFVSDSGNHRIQRFTAEGEFLVAFGQPGAGPGELDRPTDAAVDADGEVYVVDFGNDRVQVFAPGGAMP